MLRSQAVQTMHYAPVFYKRLKTRYTSEVCFLPSKRERDAPGVRAKIAQAPRLQ